MTTRERKTGPVAGGCGGADRRGVLTGALAIGLAGPYLGRSVLAATEPQKMRPQPGDVLVIALGDDKGKPIRPEDLQLGGPQELAYPMDPANNTIRDGSRLNQIAVLRLDPGELSEETAANAADGVVAYSAACTHQACPVSMWEKRKANLYCSCHGSQYDPRQNAKVVAGPAPRRLAHLPLKIEDGLVKAAGEFSGSVGAVKR